MGQRFENSETNRAEETAVPERVRELAVPAVEHTGISKRLAELPPFPATTLRLLTLSTEAVAAVDDFESAFRADPALATELLLSANSVEFGLSAQVESIRQAIMLLGLDRVNLLSVTIAMRSYMRESPRLHVMQPLWLHSIATAVTA